MKKKALESGNDIACPHCGGNASHVLEKRLRKNQCVYRRRVCELCQRRFSSSEAVVRARVA